MAIVEDASSPGKKANDNTTNVITSNSFTPPAGSLVVVFTTWGGSIFGSGSVATTSSEGGGAWDEKVEAHNGVMTAAIAVRYYAASPGSITVTSTVTKTEGNSCFQDVRVFTGADSVQTGATAVKETNTGNTTITTTTVDSLVVGTGTAFSGTTVMNPITGYTNFVVHDFTVSGTYSASERKDAATTTPGSTACGWNLTVGASGAWSWYEILPATGPVTKNGTDTGSFAAAGETASVIVKPAVETGTLTDTASVIVQVSDTGHLNESASAGEFKPVTETGTLTDTASVIVGTNKVVSDSGTLSDNAFTTMGAVASDTGTFTEDARIIVQVSETATVHDSAQVLEDGYLVAERVKVIPADIRVRRIEAEDRNVVVDAWEDE